MEEIALRVLATNHLHEATPEERSKTAPGILERKRGCPERFLNKKEAAAKAKFKKLTSALYKTASAEKKRKAKQKRGIGESDKEVQSVCFSVFMK